MIRKYVYIVVALFLLIVNWEGMKNEAVVASSTAIPDEAIRLRILAHSDQPEDQWIKRQVRDRLLTYMDEEATSMDDIETAREVIKQRLPEIHGIVSQMVDKQGYDYDVEVDFGQVPFPTKRYGDQIYPAGDYEAVRISLGSGTGANWWCVLFPPLCFVDMSHADAVPEDTGQTAGESEAEQQSDNDQLASQDGQDDEAEIEVRFFLLDWFDSFVDKIKSIWV